MIVRYINGVRMLKDLNNDKVYVIEKTIFLIFVLVSVGELNKILEISNEASSGIYQWIVDSSYVVSILICSLINYKIDNKKFIERYISVMMPSLVTMYVVLIPFNILLRPFLKRLIDVEFANYYNELSLALYSYFYIVGCFVIWKIQSKKKVKEN